MKRLLNRTRSLSRLLSLSLTAAIILFPTGTSAFADDAAPAAISNQASTTSTGGTIATTSTAAPLTGSIVENNHTISGSGTIIDVSQLNNVTNLSISQGASAILNFGNLSTLNITGTFNNAGQLTLVSTNPNTTNVTINANTINNGANALLTTITPHDSAIAGMANMVNNLSMTLNALQSITNLGTISSAGNLTMIAPTITNGADTAAAIASATAMQPVMQAMNAVNITTATLTNMGLIQSIAGNINIVSQIASNLNSSLASTLNINNVNGTLQALAGTINIGDSRFNGQQNLSLFGGNAMAQAMNINAGSGSVDIDMKELIGTINICGQQAHVTTSTDQLQLGSINLTGDPTFYNHNGSITISNDLIFNEDLAIIATGDIKTSGSGIDISTSGGNILLVAGALFTPTSGGSNNASGTGNATTTVSITGGNSVGGEIKLSGLSSFSSAGATLNEAGGNITLIAYGGTGNGSGEITLPTNLTLYSSGNGAGRNGDVTIISGADGGNSPTLVIGGVNASGGTGGGGTIQIATAQPVISGSSVDVLNGAIINGGSFIVDLTQLKTASLSTTSLLGAGSIKVDSGNHIEIAGNIISDGSIDVYAHGGKLDIFDFSQLTAKNNITLTAFDQVTINKTSNNVVNNATLTAGLLNGSPNLTQTLTSNDFVSMGSITITSLTDGVNLQRGVTSIANGGDVNILAAGDISIESNNTLTANGGYVTTIAGGSIAIDRGTCVTSIARYTSGSSGAYYGGGIGVYDEQTNFNAIAALQAIQAQQPNIGPGSVDVHLVQSNTFNRLNSGYIDANDHGGNANSTHVSLKDSSFVVDGGVISIQGELGNQQNKTNNINIQSCCFTAIAPGSTTGGTTGGTTTGGTTTGGTTTGGTTTGGTTTGGTTTGGDEVPPTTTGGGVSPVGGGTTGGTTGGAVSPAAGGAGTTTGGAGGNAGGGGAVAQTQNNSNNDNSLNDPGFFHQLPPTDLIAKGAVSTGPGVQCSPQLIAQRQRSESGQFWMVASDPGQPYSIPNDEEAVVLASAGAQFIANGDHELSLQQGRLLVAAGDRPITVFTRNGQVTVPALSTASIEQSRFGEVRVASLEGSDAKWTVQKHGQQADLAVAYGNEVSVIDSQVADAGDGEFVASGAASPGPIPGIAVAQNNLGNKASAERISQLLQCKVGCMSRDMRKRFNSFAKSAVGIAGAAPNTSMLDTSSTIGYEPAVSSGNHLVPVSATVPIAVPSSELRTLSISTGFAKCSANTIAFNTSDSNVELTRGTVLVVAQQPMTVTSEGKVIRLKSGTIAQVSSKQGALAVRTLHERSSDGLVMEANGARVAARSGIEVINANSDDQLQTQLRSTPVGRRHILKAEHAGRTFSSAEFSIPGLMIQDAVLRSMIRSNEPVEKKACHDVLKMAAILAQVTHSKGAYIPLPVDR